MELYVLIGQGIDQQKEKFKCPEQGGKINVDGGGYYVHTNTRADTSTHVYVCLSLPLCVCLRAP